RTFGRPQDGDRFTSLSSLVEEPAHDEAKDPAPPMTRRDADHGDPGRCDFPAGHSQPEGICAAGPDPPVAIHGTDHPIELPQSALEIQLGFAEHFGERLACRLDVGSNLVGGGLAQSDRVVGHRSNPAMRAASRCQTSGSSWASVWAAANRPPCLATRSTMVRMVQRSGRRSLSSSSSQVIGAETGAPAAGPTEYGATSVLIEAFCV